MCLLLFSSKPCLQKILATTLETQATPTCTQMLKQQRYITEVLYHQKSDLSIYCQTKALTIQVPTRQWAVT